MPATDHPIAIHCPCGLTYLSAASGTRHTCPRCGHVWNLKPPEPPAPGLPAAVRPGAASAGHGRPSAWRAKKERNRKARR